MNPAVPSLPPAPSNTVNGFDYALIALYFCIVIWIGFYAKRKNKNTDDYFRGGGSVPWFAAGIANWVSGFSAYMFVVAAGVAYRNGPVSLLMYTSPAWGYLIDALLFAPLWRRARLATPMEFLSRRFSTSTTWFYTVIAIGPSIVALGSGLYILCTFGSTALGLNNTLLNVAGMSLAGWQICILAIGVMMTLYSMLGGLWAAVLSDTIQSVMILVMTLIIGPVVFIHLGGDGGIIAGLSRFVHESPRGYLTQLTGPDVDSHLFLGCWILYGTLGNFSNWSVVQRYSAVADERRVRKMALLCAGLVLLSTPLWIMPAMASRVIFPDIAHAWPHFPNPTEASFVGLALTLLPHGMIGLVVAAVLSATLGGDNAALGVLSSVVTHDLYVPLRRKLALPEPGEPHKLRVARGTIVVIGVLSVATALLIPRLGGVFKLIAVLAATNFGLGISVSLSLIYRKTPWWSGFAAALAYIVFMVVSLLGGFGLDHEFVYQMISALIVPPTVFFLTRLWWNPADPRNAGILALDADLRNPVPIVPSHDHARAGVGTYFVLGILCLIFGVVLVACGFILPSTPLVSSKINLIAGAMLLMAGWLFYRVGRPASPNK